MIKKKIKHGDYVIATRTIPAKAITMGKTYKVRFSWVFSNELIISNDNKAAVAAPYNAFKKLTIKERIIRLCKSLLKRK